MDKAPRFDKIIADAVNEVNDQFANRSKSTTVSNSMVLKPMNNIEDFLTKNTPSYTRPIVDIK